MPVISGAFDVKMIPQTDGADAGSPALQRFLLDKAYHGALEAKSRGTMLAHRTADPKSAGYVAMEHVEGTLEGAAGAMVLQHSGTMDRGSERLDLTVVAESGTGAFQGIRGSMKILRENGAHRYEFDYRFAGPAS